MSRRCCGGTSPEATCLLAPGRRSLRPACHSSCCCSDDGGRLDGGGSAYHILERHVTFSPSVLETPAHEASSKRRPKCLCDRRRHEIAVEEPLPEDKWDEAYERRALIRDAFDRAPNVEKSEDDEGAEDHPDIDPAEKSRNDCAVDERDQDRDEEVEKNDVRQDDPSQGWQPE